MKDLCQRATYNRALVRIEDEGRKHVLAASLAAESLLPEVLADDLV